jgi:predicted transcriptional regulator
MLARIIMIIMDETKRRIKEYQREITWLVYRSHAAAALIWSKSIESLNNYITK